jgi:hypothetical protein
LFDADPFEDDVILDGAPGGGWCAEDFFHRHVKPKLRHLAGTHRPGEPHDLDSVAAYEALYDLLINWALKRSCDCCNGRVETPWRHDDGAHANW